MARRRNQQVYPIPVRHRSLVERLACKFKRLPGRCNVCGRYSRFKIGSENLRESVHCSRCGSSNRQRQLAARLCHYLSLVLDRRVHDLASVPRSGCPRIYNTEAQGAIHEQLRGCAGYYCSEYFGPEHDSGSGVDGVRHEDLERLSLPDASFDLVLSSDVFEHIPHPYKAHEEVRRVLKPGGRHIFTVPFAYGGFRDIRFAELGEDGQIVHLREPEYHGDPLRPEGVLVFTVFSLEMLCRLDEIGFRTVLHELYSPWHGILGAGTLLFEAIRVPHSG